MKKFLFISYVFLGLTLSLCSEVTQTFVSPAKGNFDCHSPTITKTVDGRLLVAWAGGSGAGKCDYPDIDEVGIWIAFLEGENWSKPERVVFRPKGEKCWNPVLVTLPSGEVLLFYKFGKDPRSWHGTCLHSLDHGRSWQEEILPAGILGPIKNSPLIEKERLICGTSMESGDACDPWQATSCYIEILFLETGKWRKIGPIELPGRRFGALQPALYRDAKGYLHMLCRDRAFKKGGIGFVWHAISFDDGEHWKEPVKTAIPNPDLAIDIGQLTKGALLLAYNNSHNTRYPLTLAISYDEGKTFENLVDIEKTRAEYPSIFCDSNAVHIVYAYTDNVTGQRRIKYFSFLEDDLTIWPSPKQPLSNDKGTP